MSEDITTADGASLPSTSNPVATIALYVAVVFGAFTVFLFVLLVVLYVRHRKETKILNKELEEMCCNSKDSMKYRVLRTVSENLLNNPGQAKSLLSSVGTDAEDRQMEKYRETIKILSCRYPDLQCLIKSEVQVMSESKYTLHMNKFLDFNENPLYLSQAPLKDEFPLFLQAIFDERIGVIVWVGNIIFETKEKFEPYLPINQMGSVRSGFYLAKNIKNKYTKTKGYDVFEIGISKQVTGVPVEDHTISIVHLDFWPTGQSETELVKFAKIIKYLNQLHASQMSTYNMNGVLFHCFDGVEQSAAVCGIYLGYQMWLKRKSVNILGLMRYIRKYRHSAFTCDPETTYQLIPVMYGVLEILAGTGDKMVV